MKENKMSIEKNKNIKEKCTWCKEEPEIHALKFEGTETFTVSTEYQNWDGTVEYSIDGTTWNEWDGSAIGGDTVLYMRGIGNTRFSTAWTSISALTTFEFNTDGDISASGRIDYLLDWDTVRNGGYPTMGILCFAGIFAYCTSLITAPDLPATNLANSCYRYMFQGCTSLTSAPDLPATNLADDCYRYMFYGCISLASAPDLPATNLTSSCYYSMFRGCTSLTSAPDLPATNLDSSCYDTMFYGCISLASAPDLPATNLTSSCYYAMFRGCTSLTSAPDLPATNLDSYCYNNMFYGCTSLKVAESKTGSYAKSWRIPTSGNIESEPSSWNSYMLTGTGGTFTGNPAINTTYYLDI